MQFSVHRNGTLIHNKTTTECSITYVKLVISGVISVLAVLQSCRSETFSSTNVTLLYSTMHPNYRDLEAQPKVNMFPTRCLLRWWMSERLSFRWFAMKNIIASSPNRRTRKFSSFTIKLMLFSLANSFLRKIRWCQVWPAI